MVSNPLARATFIIRSQMEYSAAAHTVVLHCLLERASTGQRHGFTDVDELLSVLRMELLTLRDEIVPLDSSKPGESTDTNQTNAYE